MTDFSIVIMAGLTAVTTVIFGWLFLKEKTRSNNLLIKAEILTYDIKALKDKVEETLTAMLTAEEDRDTALKSVEDMAEEYKKVLHHKKSSEVRVGKIGENLAPFLDGWPYDPNSFRFLGNPIDGIQFADDKIRFVEIKTGKARLSAGQKQVRELVRQGKVSFVSFRIDESGCSLIEEDLIT